jgi:hypothetical protein
MWDGLRGPEHTERLQQFSPVSIIGHGDQIDGLSSV